GSAGEVVVWFCRQGCRGVLPAGLSWGSAGGGAVGGLPAGLSWGSAGGCCRGVWAGGGVGGCRRGGGGRGGGGGGGAGCAAGVAVGGWRGGLPSGFWRRGCRMGSAGGVLLAGHSGTNIIQLPDGQLCKIGLVRWGSCKPADSVLGGRRRRGFSPGGS